MGHSPRSEEYDALPNAVQARCRELRPNLERDSCGNDDHSGSFCFSGSLPGVMVGCFSLGLSSDVALMRHALDGPFTSFLLFMKFPHTTGPLRDFANTEGMNLMDPSTHDIYHVFESFVQ